MHYLISFIIVLGVLIFVHELGHFLVAKGLGIKVLTFSLGFGPRLTGFRKGETEYVVGVLPLGGYVKMLGEGEDEEIPPEEEHRSFSARPLWQRFAVVAAGPAFNLISAVFFFFMVFAALGIPEPVPGTVVAAVTPDSPAMAAGIRPGDEILAINGRETRDWDTLAAIIGESGGAPLQIRIRRGDAELTITASARKETVHNIFGEETGKRYMLGVSRRDEVRYRDGGVLESLMAAVKQTWAMIYLTVMGVVKMFQRVIPASQIGGPILIAQLAGRQFEAGWLNLIHFMGVISVNLGIINLFPIPVLDGGHLLYFSCEAVLGRPLSDTARETGQRIGLALLIALMIFVFYNDIVRLLTQN